MPLFWYPDHSSGSKSKVLYEPSSMEIVLRMLEMADIGENDVVYDLGCGDGRIVIAAAKKAGSRGVGIDIDPVRIWESLWNAVRAGVSDRVDFYVKDLYRCNLHDASVLMLYLLPEVNLRLRFRILKEMKPGSRIVSHSHDMGDWEPDRTAVVRTHEIHCWIVPGNVSGIWEWSCPGCPYDHGEPIQLQLEQKFQKLRGFFLKPSENCILIDPEIQGEQISFTLVQNLTAGMEWVHYEGFLLGHQIAGYEIKRDGDDTIENSWSAKRDPPTMNEICD